MNSGQVSAKQLYVGFEPGGLVPGQSRKRTIIKSLYVKFAHLPPLQGQRDIYIFTMDSGERKKSKKKLNVKNWTPIISDINWILIPWLNRIDDPIVIAQQFSEAHPASLSNHLLILDPEMKNHVPSAILARVKDRNLRGTLKKWRSHVLWSEIRAFSSSSIIGKKRRLIHCVILPTTIQLWSFVVFQTFWRVV